VVSDCSALDRGGGDTGPSKSWLGPAKVSRTLDTLWPIDDRKIGKFDATRRQILRLKCIKFEKEGEGKRRGEGEEERRARQSKYFGLDPPCP